MLRHKWMVNLSLNNFRHCRKFYDGRNFHTSNRFFLRRIASSRKLNPDIRSSPEENVVAGNFEAQPLTKTFNNFYGIESDEGVVHIRAEPNPTKPSQDLFIKKFTSKQMSEKFKYTCFGKVRLDSENKLIIHGQYEEDTSISDIGEIGKATRLRKFAICNADADTNSSVGQAFLPSVGGNNGIKSKLDVSIQYESVENPTDSHLKVPELDVTKDHKGIVNDSLIDESYFPEKLLKDKKKIVSNSSISNEDVIYEDEFESKQLNNDKGVHISNMNANLDNGDVKFSDSSLQENHELSKEKNSFLDELVFGSKLENENIDKTREKSIFEITPEPLGKNLELVETTSFSNNIEKTSFIDDYYFNDRLENKLTEKDFKSAIKNISLSETILNDNVAEKDKSHDTEKEEIMHQSKTELKAKNAESNKDKFTNYELESRFSNRMSNEPETSFFNSQKLNQTNNNDSSKLKYSDNTNKFSYNEEAKEHLNPVLTSRSLPISGFSRDDNARVFDKNKPNHTNVSENNEAILSRKEANDQKQDQDQPDTAFDFVKKLRGEKVPLTYHEKISGFSEAPKEKLDSKGFRILKYQVPQLKYFTRNEMLELLVKNVLYSDDDVVVLNKPYNLVMHESKTTKDACLSKYLDDLAGELDKKSKKPKLLTVHRLDKETTGCLLLARNETSAQYLKSLFAQRKIVKTYWIVTIKVPDPLQGIIDIPIVEGSIDNKIRMVLNPDLPKDIPYRNHSKSGKNAVTHYNVVAQSGNAALVEVKPETGIKHQIRVHFGLGLACPILGDHKYTYKDKLVPQKLQTDLLHKLQVRQSKVRYVPMHIYARSIFIPQYTEGRNLFVMAPMPIHMSKNLQRLKFRKK